MRAETSKRSAWLARVLGFGDVAGTPEEVRALLQRRLSLYAGLATAGWSSTLLVTRQVTWAHAGVVVAAVVVWLVLSRGRYGLTALGATDALATILQGLTLGWMAAALDPPAVPQTAVLLAVTHVLVARAALVPSSAPRTATISVAAAVPIVVGVLWAHRFDTTQPLPSIAQLSMTTALWSAIAVMSSTVISLSIYGLQQRAQAVSQLGQYTLEEKIGEGGMGVVYRARHALLRRATAVKLLSSDQAGSTAIARFEREVQLTSRLTHPNTIAIFDYGRTPDGVFYYAMEYLEGIDLQTLVKLDGPQPAARVVHVLRQAAGALAEAHHVGLIHRDVKPANIVLCERGLQPDFVKVLDFGLVREMQTASTLSSTNTLLGTPSYMSPEHIRSPAGIDGRSDLYALGAVGYFLLTGVHAFDGKTPLEVCRKHLHEVPPPASSKTSQFVPAALDQALAQCLEKNPDDRPKNAFALLRALNHCQSLVPWSDERAHAWWQLRGQDVRDQRLSRLAAMQRASTLAVDLADRGISQGPPTRGNRQPPRGR